MDFHWWELVGIMSAVLIAWGSVMMRMARVHIDRRIDMKLENCVKEAIRNGVTERMDRIELKLDRLTELHLRIDNEERRH